MRSLLLYTLLLSGFLVFSRAGSGGSSAGGSGGGSHFYSGYRGHSASPDHDTSGINAVFVCFGAIAMYAAYMTFFYFLKPWINKRKMRASFERDPFWDYSNIMEYVGQFYIELQQAWTKGDLLPLKHRLSPQLYRSYTGILSRNKQRGVRNITEEIEITKTGIIYFDDYVDDSKDAIAILIQGRMKDYYSRSGVIATEDKKPFKDAYVFVRKNNQLILDEIINEPDMYQVIKPKTYTETT